MNTPVHTNLVRELFDRTVALPMEQREAFLAGACWGEPQVLADVRSLLAAHERAGQFLADPGISGEGLPSSTQLQPGTRVASYTILKTIGEGGYGVVYVAEQDRPLRRNVALKVIKAGMDTRQVIARFELEREALALMDHPNIAKVFEAGASENGRPYFVMEWVDGIPITEFCQRYQMSLEERLKLFISVCSAIEHAHARGIIHRDLKPANVIVAIREGAPVAKVIDFGIAKALRSDEAADARTTITIGPQFLGTPQYMSPEQAKTPPGDVDVRSDVYSLGVLLYELLTDSVPFDPARLRSVGYDKVHQILNEIELVVPSARLVESGESLAADSPDRAGDARKLARQVKGDLDWIVVKAMEKDPARRYDSADALSLDIAHYLASEPVTARASTTIYRLKKFIRRRRRALLGVAALLIAAIASFTAAKFSSRETARAFVVAPSPRIERLEPGLIADVYSGTRFETFIKTRIDRQIVFIWPNRSPPDSSIDTAKYSIRWKGYVDLPVDHMVLAMEADDGARLIIDGQTEIEFDKPQRKLSRDDLWAGRHSITVEYWNRLAGGHAELLWSFPDNPVKYVDVPGEAFSHARGEENQSAE